MFYADKRFLYMMLIVIVIVNLMGMGTEDWLVLLLTLPGVLVAITFHEYAHALAATKLGDDTPRLQDRLNLNPLSHIDPIGFILLLFVGFGWGKPVEINALWYNALKVMQELSSICDDKEETNSYKELAEDTKISFTNKFYNKRRKCLYDVIGDGKIRPNQLFALSLSFPVIDPDSEIAENMIGVVEKKLLTDYGLRTLAKGEPGYVETYEGEPFKRDASYHQGPVWPWLLGLYYNSLKNMIKEERTKKKKQELENKLEEFCKTTEKTFMDVIYRDGVMRKLRRNI